MEKHMQMQNRVCKTCEEELPAERFYTNKRGYTNLHCRKCNSVLRKRRYEDKGRYPTASRKFCRTCGHERDNNLFSKSAYSKDGYAYSCKICRFDKLKERYGLTKEDYEIILNRQNKLCAICKCLPEQSNHKILHVDHNHTTGKVRGLLCSSCNGALGLFKDNPEVVAAALLYLKDYGLCK